MKMIECKSGHIVVKAGLGSPTNARGGMDATVVASFDELCKVFGYPQRSEVGNESIKAEWFGWINGLQYAIDNSIDNAKTMHSSHTWMLHGEHTTVPVLVYNALKVVTGRRQ